MRIKYTLKPLFLAFTLFVSAKAFSSVAKVLIDGGIEVAGTLISKGMDEVMASQIENSFKLGLKYGKMDGETFEASFKSLLGELDGKNIEELTVDEWARVSEALQESLLLKGSDNSIGNSSTLFAKKCTVKVGSDSDKSFKLIGEINDSLSPLAKKYFDEDGGTFGGVSNKITSLKSQGSINSSSNIANEDLLDARLFLGIVQESRKPRGVDDELYQTLKAIESFYSDDGKVVLDPDTLSLHKIILESEGGSTLKSFRELINEIAKKPHAERKKALEDALSAKIKGDPIKKRACDRVNVLGCGGLSLSCGA